VGGAARLALPAWRGCLQQPVCSLHAARWLAQALAVARLPPLPRPRLSCPPPHPTPPTHTRTRTRPPPRLLPPAEFEQALAADRERQERREAERARLEAEALAAREAEAREREAREAEARAAQDALDALQRRREQKRAALAEEPGEGQPSSSIRIRLPDGSNHQRRFCPEADVSAVFDFVDGLDSGGFTRYKLVSNFPRQAFDQEGSSGSLRALGLTPQAALFVQPDDE
jgi:hypothetical protein